MSGYATATASLRGVLPVFQTPFHEDGSIDHESLLAEIDWILEQGASGVVMGMVSEVLRLTTDERNDVATHVCAHVRERAPVVIAIGAESSYVAQQHARAAEEAGAAGLMAAPPVATAAGEADLRAYFSGILDAVDVPLVVQDASGYVGAPLSMDLQAGLLDEYGTRVLFKPEAEPLGSNLSALRDATSGRARIFEGSGGIALVDAYRRGIVGTMPGAEVCWAIVALWQALEAGDQARIDAINGPLAGLITLQSGLDGYLAVEKHLLVRQGVIPRATIRGPVAFHLDHETREEVDRLFDLLAAAVTRTADGHL